MIIFLIIILSVSIIVFTIGWITHITIVTDNVMQWGWGSYKTFKREFSKYEWDNEYWRGHSLWDRKNNCQIHADIVYFNNIGMVMRTPIDYVLMHLFLRNFLKSDKKSRYNWNHSTIPQNKLDWNKLDEMINEWKTETGRK